jgi:hypothetical protein
MNDMLRLERRGGKCDATHQAAIHALIQAIQPRHGGFLIDLV